MTKLPCAALHTDPLPLLGACGEVLLARADALEEAALRGVRERCTAVFHPSISLTEPARFSFGS